MSKIAAILWAQFRITRNHLPRTTVGGFLLGLIGVVWYGVFTFLAVMIALLLPELSLLQLQQWVPVGLLGVFAFWQLIPMFTLSGGWSLQLNRLLPYPIRHSTLFTIEIVLRLTNAPEMIILLLGALVGLLRNPHIGLSAFALLLFIPFNLFLSLAFREWVLQAFARNRFREIFTILIVSIGILPQILIRTPFGHRVAPYLLSAARSLWTPWGEVASLSLGTRVAYLEILLLACWTLLCYSLARRQFEKGLHRDQVIRAGASADELAPGRVRKPSVFAGLADAPNRIFKDPMAALLQKEYRSLLRMPRFRVMFGMACVFSVLVFVPMTLNMERHGENAFLRNNFLVMTMLYGVLILSDSVFLNFFGFDRQATQIYFISPIPLRTVLIAKNLTAITFIAVQAIGVTIVAVAIRIAVTPLNILNAIAAAAAVGIFFLSIGNVMSVTMARPLDPAQTFRNRSSGKLQLYMLLAAIGMCVLVGLGILARWATDRNWAMLAVLGVEFIVGYIVYRVATDSAVEKAEAQREQLIDSLSKGAGSAVLGLGIS